MVTLVDKSNNHHNKDTSSSSSSSSCCEEESGMTSACSSMETGSDDGSVSSCTSFLEPTDPDDFDDDEDNKNESSSRSNGSNIDGRFSFKVFLLALMVVQTSGNVLVGRHSRSSVSASELYEVNHAVMGIEVTKFTLACILEYYTSGGKLVQNIQTHVVQRPRQALQMIIPAMLYLVQNTLLYVALTNLTAPMFCVAYQGKLVTTAMVSVVMLRRSYSMQQWICLVAISLGVAIVVNGEQQQQQSATATAATADVINGDDVNMSDQTVTQDDTIHRNLALGLTAVCISCFSSALAGVYFEKILKNKSDHNNNNKSPKGVELLEPQQASLWMLNIQLAFYSIILAAAQGGLKNTGGKPYFYGFNAWTYLLIFIQAVGGLLVAAVIKYADNVLKGLATGVSVVLSSLLSWVLFRTHLTLDFLLGGTVILLAVWFFGQPLPTCLTAALSPARAWFVRDNEQQHHISKRGRETELYSLLPK